MWHLVNLVWILLSQAAVSGGLHSRRNILNVQSRHAYFKLSWYRWSQSHSPDQTSIWFTTYTRSRGGRFNRSTWDQYYCSADRQVIGCQSPTRQGQLLISYIPRDSLPMGQFLYLRTENQIIMNPSNSSVEHYASSFIPNRVQTYARVLSYDVRSLFISVSLSFNTLYQSCVFTCPLCPSASRKVTIRYAYGGSYSYWYLRGLKGGQRYGATIQCCPVGVWEAYCYDWRLNSPARFYFWTIPEPVSNIRVDYYANDYYHNGYLDLYYDKLADGLQLDVTVSYFPGEFTIQYKPAVITSSDLKTRIKIRNPDNANILGLIVKNGHSSSKLVFISIQPVDDSNIPANATFFSRYGWIIVLILLCLSALIMIIFLIIYICFKCVQPQPKLDKNIAFRYRPPLRLYNEAIRRISA